MSNPQKPSRKQLAARYGDLARFVSIKTIKPQPSKREQIWVEARGICHWCSRQTRFSEDNAPDMGTIDYIIPRSKGGTEEPGNLVLGCVQCISRRGLEDRRGLPEGALLGQFRIRPKVPKPEPPRIQVLRF